MADFYTDIATTINGSKGMHERVSDSRLTSGDVKLTYATYTFVNTEAAADVIYLSRFTTGKKYLPAAGGFVFAETGAYTSMSCKIGYAYDDADLTDDDDAFRAAAALTAASKVDLLTGASSLTGFDPSGDGWFTLTITAANTPVAAKLLLVAMPVVIAG